MAGHSPKEALGHNSQTGPVSRSNGDNDDFELISESNLEEMLSSLRAAAAGNSGPEAISRQLAEEQQNGPEYDFRSINGMMDAAEVFELVQKEHKLLKDELVSQSMTLRERLTALEERDRRKEQELASLKNELDATKLALSEKDNRLVELDRQLQYFKQSSEKVDLLHAKLMEADDVVKHQNSIIQQFQTDGFVSVQPPMLTDHLLAKELSQKDERLKRLEMALATVESESLKAQEENNDLKENVSELRGLVTALQQQAEVDKSDWATTRDELEQQINSLVERMSEFDPDFVAAQPQHTVTQRVNLPQQTLTESGNSDTCPCCHFPILREGSHHPCPSLIDGLD